MWTVINRVNPGAGSFELMPHPRVQGIQLCSRHEPLGNATLVGHHDDEILCNIEQVDGLTHPRKKLHLLPPRHILTLGSFTVDHSVAIEKGSLLHEKSSAPPTLR